MKLIFSEKIILSNQPYFAEVRHIKLQGSNFEIGKKLGQIAKNQHQIQKLKANNSIQTRSQKMYMQKNYPIFFERMLGIASSYGLDINDDTYDFSVLGEPNLNTGCSAVYFPPNLTELNSGIVSRNLDFFLIPSLSKPYIIEMYPDKGYPSLSILSFELLGEALEGINSEGLVVIHLADEESTIKYNMEPTHTNAVGLNELKAIQMLLDTCANVEEAKQALLTNKHFYMVQPLHLLIADRFGNSFVWEYSHAHNKEFIITNEGNPQIVTNFLLHSYKSTDKLPTVNSDKYCMYNRYHTIYEAVKSNKGPYTLDFIKDTLAEVHIEDSSFSSLPQVPIRTLLKTIYDTNERSIQISFYLKDKYNHEQPNNTISIHSDYYKFSIS